MRKRIKASFTLEAVLIMPIVLFTMVFIIYLSFYLHDICKIQGLTDLVLQKTVLNLKHEADIRTGKINYEDINKGILRQISEKAVTKEGEIENYLFSMLSKGLFITSITDIHVSKEVRSILIRVKGTYHIPIKAVQQLISSDKIIVVETKAAYHNPADTIRISEVILDTGSEIKGFDKLKENIGKILFY